MKWLWHLTGGRPMEQKQRLFFDQGRWVYRYVDKLGRPWMAASAWDWRRVGPEAEIARSRR